jgi:hypothetical protein
LLEKAKELAERVLARIRDLRAEELQLAEAPLFVLASADRRRSRRE